MPCFTPLKGFVKVGGGFTGDASKGNGTKMEVACGQCLGCRLDHARMWSMRIIHEASLFDGGNGSSFVTLTYDDEHLPEDWSLKLRDFQLFMKRLRKRFDCKIRFYMCAEYGMICRHGMATEENDDGIVLCPGCKVGRPHFHAILFNCRFENKFVVGRGHGDIIYYSDVALIEDWQMGFVSIGDVTMESAGYVARYAVKKITGKMAESHYITFDDLLGSSTKVVPEFSTQSNRPGIGAKWFEKYHTDVFPSDEVPVPGQGVFKKVPRYYQDIMERSDVTMIEEVKADRKRYLKLHKEEFSRERLMAKYKVKKVQINGLKRKMK